MPIRNPKEVFIMLLSDVRQSAERGAKIFQELGQAAQHEEIKEALDARAYISEKIVGTLDECFNLIGEKPVKLPGKLQDAIVEDFRRDLNEIQSPEAKRLYVLAKASQLMHFRRGEYEVLIAAADESGHPGVGILLQSCIADRRSAFVERTRRFISELHRELVAA